MAPVLLLHHKHGNKWFCHLYLQQSSLLAFPDLQHLVYFSYKCVSEAVYSSIPKQTSFNFSKEIYKYTEREQLYSLTHVIISLYRGLTTFTLFSNTQRHSLSTKPTLGNSISFTACLPVYLHTQFMFFTSYFFLFPILATVSEQGYNLGVAQNLANVVLWR